MTAVPDSERRTRYAPVVPTTRFDVGFTLYGGADVTVYIDGVEKAQDDATYPWSVDATFTDGECTTAQVVAAGSGWSGLTVDVVGKIPPSRVDQFLDGLGIPAGVLNVIVNRIVAGGREIFDARLRWLALPFGEEVTQPLPSVADRAGMVLAFDDDGQPTVTDLIGDSGWSPVFAVVNDSARRVLQVSDWQGGAGTKPATGLYVGASGLTAVLASAVDVRGATGASGAGTGDMLAAQNLNDVADKPTARTNLGLGALAVLATVSTAVIDAAAVTAAKIADGAITAVKIAAGVVGNVALANMVAGTIKGRGTASTGAPEDIAAGVNITIDATSVRSDVTTVNRQTASYTAVLTDAGELVTIDNASANTFTIPPNASIAFPVGAWINYSQDGAGQTTITPGAGVTLHSRNGLKCSGQYAMVTLVKRDTNVWQVGGDLTP